MNGRGGRGVLWAAQHGDVSALQREPPITAFQQGADSPLIVAVKFGRFDAAKWLIEAGADVNHAGELKNTALHCAVKKTAELTQLLLDHGADPGARNASDLSALDEFILAVKPRRLDLRIVDVLLDAGFDLSTRGTRYAALGRSPLALAAACGHVPTVIRLLEAGLDVNEGAPPGSHVFRHALQERDDEARRAVLATLVRYGLDVRACDPYGARTVLSELCRLRDVETVKLLLQRGADPNALARTTPLAIAEELADEALVDLLLEHGARAPHAPIPPRLSRAAAAAERTPLDASARLEHAEALFSAGFHAAAAAEGQVAGALGAIVDGELRRLPGTAWSFVRFPLSGEAVTAHVADALFPGARVSDGAVELPLVVAQCAACDRCDDDGLMACPDCQGTGLGADGLAVDCQRFVPCRWCGQSGYLVGGPKMAKGACAHPAWRGECSTPDFNVERCATCGLAGVSTPTLARVVACAYCGRLGCTCLGG